MAVGEAFAVEDTASALNVSNTVEATESYTGTVQLQQGDWSGQFTGQNTLNTPAANANLPIIVGHSKFVRGSGITRSVATDTIRINLANQDIRGGSAGRYVRISGGADEATSQGVGIFEVASGDDFLIRRSVSFNLGDRVGDYDRTAGDPMGFWAAVLPANDRLYMSLAATVAASGRYGNTPRPIDLGPTPSALSEGSFGQFTWNNDAGHPVGTTFTHTGGAATFTIAASKKVLCVLTYQCDANTDRNSVIVFVRHSDGTTLEGGFVSTYLRNASSDIMCGSLIFPIFTGGATETFDVVFAEQVEETVPEVTIIDASIQLIDLTEADWVMAAHNLAVTDLDSLVYKTASWNTTLQEDTASWSHDPVTNNSRLTNNSGGTITALVGAVTFWDRNLATNASRKVPHCQIARNGTRLEYGVWGEFNRGAQSADDQFVSGASGAIPVELTSAQYIEAQYRDLANTAASAMEVNNDQFTGSAVFWAVRIDNLGAAAPQSQTYLADLLLAAGQSQGYTADALLQSAGVLATYSLDALLQAEKARTYTVDAILKALGVPASYTVDALLQERKSQTYLVDMLLSAGGIQQTYSIDAFLQSASVQKTYLLDALLKETGLSAAYTADAFLQALGVARDYTLDAMLQEIGLSLAYAIDVVLGTFKIQGVTKDNAGAILGGCSCVLFKDNLDNTLTFVAFTTSDGGGNYTFDNISDGDAQYIVYAFKDDSPHVFDATDHVLQPVGS